MYKFNIKKFKERIKNISILHFFFEEFGLYYLQLFFAYVLYLKCKFDVTNVESVKRTKLYVSNVKATSCYIVSLRECLLSV